MDGSVFINLGFIGVIVVFIIVAVVILAVLPTSGSSAAVSFDGPFDLNGTKTAVNTSDFSTPSASTAFLKDGDASLQGFLYLDTITKTGEYMPCGSSPSQPDCDSGLYQTCTCEGVVSCNTCSHIGYKTLANLYGVYELEILTVPDASRPNAVGAQLTVLTTRPTASGKVLFKETVRLPALPLQKWVMLTLVHQGRRVDVYYNHALVSSATLENTIVTDSLSVTPIQVGDSGLTGVLGLFKFYTRALKGPDVRSQYLSQVDTRGAPTAINTGLAQASAAIAKAQPGSLLSRLCLDGSCLGGGAYRPPSVTIGSESPLAMGSISAQYAIDTPYS